MTFDPKILKKGILLKDYTNFKLGGPADLFFEAQSESELISVVKYALKSNLPIFIFGGGTNLVVSDNGIDGIVVKNSIKYKKILDKHQRTLTLSSGYNFADLVDESCKAELSGAESFAGIPGTIGGAIFGNAGAYGKSISDILISAEVLFPNGELHSVNKDFFNFTYRNSFIKQNPGYTVVSATFQLNEGNKSEIESKISEIKQQRAEKHPGPSIGCAGSYFKNLPPAPGETRRTAAGKILDELGAKSLKVGGASIYEKHANFIINKGQATASDVKELADLLKAAAKNKFGITLEEEVRYIGRW